MNKKIFIALIASATTMLSMPSCSNEDGFESLHQQSENALVQIQPSVEQMTVRGVTTISNLNDFKVSAFLKQDDLRSVFMDQVKVSRTEGKWQTEGEYIWPYAGTLTFCSYSPSSLNVTMPSATEFTDKAPVISYTAQSNSYQQSDVLYAVNANHQYTGSTASSVVNVNFRHALSQIVFCAKCEKTDWTVDIADVQIHNVKSSGEYTFPLATTAKLTGKEESDIRGSWTLKDELHSYNTGFDAVENISASTVNLTTSDNCPLLLIPQTKDAWDPGQDPKCDNKGAYFMIRCKLKKKTTEGNYAVIWPGNGSTAYGYVAVPVNINWQEGKKYTYVFNFKDGAGFIPPTETGSGEDIIPGNAVLAKIAFDVLVDDFTSADSKTEIEM